MPIYSYRPKVDHAGPGPEAHPPHAATGGPEALESSCCHFDYLHLPGAPDSEAWQRCPTCGRDVERVPSSFSTSGLAVPATAQALRRAGCGDFAEAWEQSEREAAAARTLPGQTKALGAPTRVVDESSALRALATASGHVCTASCRHGSAG